MEKHAYLIMAHNNLYVLEKLLKLLDYEKNDIFLHVDKKCKEFKAREFKNKLKKSNLYIVKRRTIEWASPSQMMCEIELLEQATTQYKYSYYHLLSGSDMPLKSQKNIHSFFEKNKNKEFLNYCDKFDNTRTSCINLFNNIGRKHSKINSVKYKLRTEFIKLQLRLNYNHMRKYKMEIKKGANWFSITDNLARYIVDNKNRIRKMFRYSICPDEHFLQTFLWDSKYRKNLYKPKIMCTPNLRYIDWNRGQPYVFKKEDYNLLINCNELFARKFDINTDKEIIDMIYDYVKTEEKNV